MIWVFVEILEKLTPPILCWILWLDVDNVWWSLRIIRVIFKSSLKSVAMLVICHIMLNSCLCRDFWLNCLCKVSIHLRCNFCIFLLISCVNLMPLFTFRSRWRKFNGAVILSLVRVPFVAHLFDVKLTTDFILIYIRSDLKRILLHFFVLHMISWVFVLFLVSYFSRNIHLRHPHFWDRFKKYVILFFLFACVIMTPISWDVLVRKLLKLIILFFAYLENWYWY